MSINRNIMGILVHLVMTNETWNFHDFPQITFESASKKEHSEKELPENTSTLTNQIKNELEEENYEITGIGIHHQSNQINIKVSGTQQYVENIEKNIKKIVYNLVEQTIFKDYSIKVSKEIISEPTTNPWFQQE